MEWYLMVWRKYAEFSGRSRRSEYWMFVLFNLLAMFALVMLGGVGVAISQDYGAVLFVPFVVYVLALIIPSLAVGVRRFHDSGKSGGLYALLIVLGIIPFVGLICSIIQIVILCLDSEPGVNEYGPNPKFPEQAVGMFAGNTGFTSMGLSAQPQALTGENSFGFCRNCGAVLKDASPFCARCGTHS
jgi:uncharacterized membrane protein YhaH (DUF805 family)